MEPQIRFCASADGTRIAYAILGEGRPLLVIPGWGHSFEWDWSHPSGRAWLERAAQGRLVVSFDRRGWGASQRDVEDISLQAQVADVEALADRVGFDRFDVFAAMGGAPVATVYVADHPGRVCRLVLWIPGMSGTGTEDPRMRSFLELVRGHPAMARRAMADALFPSGPTDLQIWVANYWREAVTPEMLARYWESTASGDVRPYLPRVNVPTLVLHRRGYRDIPVGVGRAAAGLIPDSRFIVLEGDIGLFYCGDISYLETVTRFLDEGRPAEPAAPPQAAAVHTILFTDVEGSTALTQRLGDAAAREVLREHERITREALREHGGAEVKTMGDGFMASFASATRALECAVALQRAFEEWNAEAGRSPSTGSGRAGEIRVRIGLNAGEPIAEEADLFGTAVIVAARIAGQAGGGEVLASDVVRQLVAGKGFLFSDRGEQVLRGFKDPVRLYEVRWRE